jgi:hypothetical protein
MYGHDTNLVPNATNTGFDPGPSVSFTGGFVQSEYWLYPWLIGIMRYDFVNSPTDFRGGIVPTLSTTRNRFSPGFQMLVRANIKVGFEYHRLWEQPVPDTQKPFRPNGFKTGIDLVF